MPELLDHSTFENQILGTIFSVFTDTAVLPTAIGLYGVMVFAVGQRPKKSVPAWPSEPTASRSSVG